jgi:hypothetical protein
MPFTQRRARAAEIFKQEDPSIHMLGLPRSHPRRREWLAIAIIVGATAALVLIALLAL